MQESGVTFKGTVNGLTIIMKESLDFASIVKQIESKLSIAGKFFKGASIVVKYRGKKLSIEEEESLFKLLSDKSGAKVKSIEKDDSELAEIKSNIENFNTKTITKKNIKIKSFYNNCEDHDGLCKFYKGTVRSGQMINFDGNVIILGDVNPGGMIIATGNVVVMGALRGNVHAGSNGGVDSVVVALYLHPTQLRIADIITRPPDESGPKNQNAPEMAYIRDNKIYIDRYLPQR